MCLQDYQATDRLNIRLLAEGFELLFEAVDDPLRVGHQALIGGHTQHHAAGVAEDADAQAEVTGLRDPEHHVVQPAAGEVQRDRKSTRLNSSHSSISYAVFCL